MTTTSHYQLRSAYWADTSARAAFKDFVRQVFGIDMERWDAFGYWDENYRPFSLFAEDGRVVASTCLYSMRTVIGGRAVRVGQISGMGVLPELRRRGLGREVTRAALRWASETGHKFFMLFSSEEALPFYRSQGFTFMAEHIPVLKLSANDAREGADAASTGTHALDMNLAVDRTLLFQLASGRCPVSQQFGVLNERLLMFRAIFSPPGSSVHYIPSLEVAVLFRRRDKVLTIFDVVGSRVPAFSELLPFLIAPGDREVIFWFMTDSLGDPAEFGAFDHRPLPGNNLHVQPGFPISSPFVLPFTAQA